jgi:hypothetical protein
MHKKASALFMAVILLINLNIPVTANRASDWGIRDMIENGELKLITENLPVRDIMPSLLIVINTDGRQRNIIDEYIEDYRARMFVTGEVTNITHTLYYTTMPTGFTSESTDWGTLSRAVVNLIEREYPNANSRPRWRRVLLYINNRIIEDAHVGVSGSFAFANADFHNNMRITGINNHQSGIHGSIHGHEGSMNVMLSTQIISQQQFIDFLTTYGNCHVMSQTELNAWAKVFGLPTLDPDDPRWNLSRRIEGGANGWNPASGMASLFEDYPEFVTPEVIAFFYGDPNGEHELWVKQKFITELNVDKYEAEWDFEQYPLPFNQAERDRMIQRLRMGELTYEDCVRLFGGTTFTTADALNILKYVAGSAALSAEQRRLYDFGGSGSINTADALNILKIVAGLGSSVELR